MASHIRDLRDLGVRPKKGVYTFTYGDPGVVGEDGHAFMKGIRENDRLDAQERLVEDLSIEYDFPKPKEGDVVHITVKDKKVTGIRVEKQEGGRRSRLNKKTRRSKGKRGHTKRA